MVLQHLIPLLASSPEVGALGRKVTRGVNLLEVRSEDDLQKVSSLRAYLLASSNRPRQNLSEMERLSTMAPAVKAPASEDDFV